MTMVAKRRGLWAWVRHQLYEIVKEEAELAEEAERWDLIVCCVQCHGEVPVHSQFCPHCRTWLDEEEARRTGSLGDTSSLYVIKVKNTGYPIQLRGRRLFEAYRQDILPLVNDDAKWLR